MSCVLCAPVTHWLNCENSTLITIISVVSVEFILLIFGCWIFLSINLLLPKNPIVCFTGLENEDMTPTLKQIWVTVRQLQQDMNQIKIQVNEERALRSYLQQLLMGHLEGLSSTKNCWANTTKWFLSKSLNFYFSIESNVRPTSHLHTRLNILLYYICHSCIGARPVYSIPT